MGYVEIFRLDEQGAGWVDLSDCFLEIFMLNLQSKKIKKGSPNYGIC